jgi:hemerythrin-like domain-containing protein
MVPYQTTEQGFPRADKTTRQRVLLIYDEVIWRIDAKQDVPPQTVTDSAQIIRKSIEDYHQKLEEEQIFPLFRKYYGRHDVLRLYAQKLLDLVDILNEQHHAGRRLTDRILSTLQSLKTPDDRQKLAHDLHAYIRMYQPPRGTRGFGVISRPSRNRHPPRISGPGRKV